MPDGGGIGVFTLQSTITPSIGEVSPPGAVLDAGSEVVTEVTTLPGAGEMHVVAGRVRLLPKVCAAPTLGAATRRHEIRAVAVTPHRMPRS
jgi:hypothetical protein